MKTSDFKLIATLPDAYDYEFFNDGNGNIMILGKNGREVIGWRIVKNELIPIDFNLFQNRMDTNE